MFTNRHEIRRIDLLKSEYTQVVPTLKNAVALDVDVSTNKMFWCASEFHLKPIDRLITKAVNIKRALDTKELFVMNIKTKVTSVKLH